MAPFSAKTAITVFVLGALSLNLRAGSGAAQPDATLPGYEEQLADNDAAAQAFHAENPSGVVESIDALPGGSPCAAGEVPWQRDSITFLCAAICASDAECGPNERCRIVDVFDPAPDIVLVDDMPPEEVPAWLEGYNDDAPPVLVCDPFFDIDGATDVDLIANTG